MVMPASVSPTRALQGALFTVVGVGFFVVWLRMLDSGGQIPEAPSNWFGVLFFSALLIALAFALPTFARQIGGRIVFRASLVPAVGAGLGGVANILEDGLHLDWAFWLFILSLAIIDFGLFAFAIVVAFIGRDRGRLLAAVPAATLAAVLLFPVIGGVLMLVAWLAAAALALGRPAQREQEVGEELGRSEAHASP